MASQPESAPPLMWVNPQTRYNVVILTADMLYLASVKKADLPRIDLGLEDGKAADELLPAKAWKIPLANIERIQLKHVQVVVHQLMNKEVTIHYKDASKTRKATLTLDSQGMRDEFVQNLNERVGGWPIQEANESPWVILANYLYIILVVSLLAALFSWLGLTFKMNDDGSLPKRYWDATGPWGLVVPAMMICVAVLITGIRQLRTPPIVVTYEPK